MLEKKLRKEEKVYLKTLIMKVKEMIMIKMILRMKGKIQEYWVNVKDLKKKVIVEQDVQTKNQF
jgi:hypothetical protein